MHFHIHVCLNSQHVPRMIKKLTTQLTTSSHRPPMILPVVFSDHTDLLSWYLGAQYPIGRLDEGHWRAVQIRGRRNSSAFGDGKLSWLPHASPLPLLGQ